MSHLTTFYIQSIVLISIHKTFKFPKVSAMYYSQQNIPLQQNPARLQVPIFKLSFVANVMVNNFSCKHLGICTSIPYSVH